MWLAYIIIGTAVVGTEAVGIAVVRRFNAGIITNRTDVRATKTIFSVVC